MSEPDATDVFYGPFRWSHKAAKLADLAKASSDPRIAEYAVWIR